MPKEYRRTGDILAEQLTSENADELALWCAGMVVEEIDPEDETNKYVGINVPTFNGIIRVSEGAYLVYNRRTGDFSSMSKSSFESLHEEA